MHPAHSDSSDESGTGSLLRHLNPEQRAAVTLPCEPSLILAGAGSGKTRVLTTRIAWLLATAQASPGGILAVTFTNKAAKEMLARLAALLPFPVRGMWIGTFHGLCNRFLRGHWKLAELPQSFQILDASDQVAAVKRVIKAMGLDEQRFVAKQVAWFIAGNKEDGLRPAEVKARDTHARKLVEVYEAYEEQCRREGVVDFAELLLRSYEVLRDQPTLREHYQHRFAHVLVDEFQDTNRLQYEWLKMLAPPAGGQGVFAVGDDDQSIYAFRGANVGNMADFEREYGVRRVVKLERNYRSYGHILDSANALIAHNAKRLGKNLRTDAGPGEPVRVVEAASDYAEAQWMVEELQAQHRSGTPRSETAVLYRSNAQSRVLESALFNAGVPYRVYGGLRFFERAEIKHALAYLRLLENPDDDTSFLRVANFPTRGIGARTIEQLQDAARSQGSSLHGAARAIGAKGSNTRLLGFVELIDSIRDATRGATLRQIIRTVLDRSGLLAHYGAEREGAERIENLDELINAAEAFVTQEGFGRDAVGLPLDEVQPTAASGAPRTPDGATGEIMSPLAAFLTHAALEAGDNQAQAGQDAVQLMTVHSAKGLEFDCVFITGLEEGLFPHENSIEQRDGLEEERRLMYVAITRARKRLCLSFSQSRMLHGHTRLAVKSRFIDELPESALKWLSPRRQGFGSGYAGSYQAAWARGSGLGSIVGVGAVEGRSAPSGPGWAAARAGAGAGLRIGQAVFHAKFGEGVVLTLEGGGADARAQVHFARHGTKWLALSIAKLTPVE